MDDDWGYPSCGTPPALNTTIIRPLPILSSTSGCLEALKRAWVAHAQFTRLSWCPNELALTWLGDACETCLFRFSLNPSKPDLWEPTCTGFTGNQTQLRWMFRVPLFLRPSGDHPKTWSPSRLCRGMLITTYWRSCC